MSRPLQLADPVSMVSGVGPRRALTLQRAGIASVADLLLYLPADYEDRSRVVAIADLENGVRACVQATVRTQRRVRRGGPTRLELVVADETDELRVVFFNQPYLSEALAVDREVMLFGPVSEYDGQLQMTNPVHGDGAGTMHVGRPVAVYRPIGDLGQAAVRRLMGAALAALDPELEGVPHDARARYELPPLADAFRDLHQPESAAALGQWRRRRSPAHHGLVVQEMVDYQVANRLARRRAQSEAGHARKLGASLRRRVVGVLGFELTGGQRAALDEVFADLAAPAPMHRLVNGDVGCGKTAVAGPAMLAVALAGEQAVLLAPTELLARQHARTLEQWATPLGLEVELVLGGAAPADKRRIAARLASGQTRVVVGTHALLESRVRFARLGLAVIDEQQRFGVRQRAALRKKGGSRAPDLLVMTATPIPRSLALTLYGDLDVSRIEDLPPGRAPVTTLRADDLADDVVQQRLRAAVARGERAYVVGPRIGDETAPDSSPNGVGSVLGLRERLRQSLPGVEIGLVHGRMPAPERDAAMQRFIVGDSPVLAATTLIEVGVDVAEATLMICDEAYRFGLAQLHQLRGRVGRGDRPGTCILLGRGVADAAARRLDVLCESHDGFRIAELDLQQRGAGDALGTRQSGHAELRVADPVSHADWFVEAATIAAELVDRGDADGEAYRRRLRDLWRTRLRDARAG